MRLNTVTARVCRKNDILLSIVFNKLKGFEVFDITLTQDMSLAVHSATPVAIPVNNKKK